MKRLLILAAASSAGLMTFAAHSQEAPFNPAAGNPAAFASMKAASGEAPQSQQQPSVRVIDQGRIEIVSSAAAPASQAAEQVEKSGTDRVAVAATTETTVSSSRAVLTRAAKPAATGKYDDIITRYASAYGVPAPLAHAIVRLESNYRANARGRAGEIGLMQIKHSTARGMGYAGSAKGLYDPETNIKYGMKYLATAHKLGGGNTCGTILRYNAGHGAKRMNPTSAAYCAKVKRLLGSA